MKIIPLLIMVKAVGFGLVALAVSIVTSSIVNSIFNMFDNGATLYMMKMAYYLLLVFFIIALPILIMMQGENTGLAERFMNGKNKEA